MFYEPVQTPDTFAMFGGVIFPTGFSKNPGADESSRRHALNDHTYCCEVSEDMCAEKEPPLDQEETCRDFHQRRLNIRDRDAERYNVPLIITEFGACTSSQNCINEINAVVDACDDYLTSWTYWQFKPFMDITTSAGNTSEGFYEKDGSLQLNKARSLSRTYLRNTQGTPLKMHFNKFTGVFTATFIVDTNIQAPTDLYLNEDYFYKTGYFLKLTSDGKTITEGFEIDHSVKNHLFIDFTDPKFMH